MSVLREPQEIIKDTFSILGWIIVAIVTLALTIGAGGFYAGYRYGRSHCEPVPSVKPNDSCPIHRHGSAVEKMAERNLVWRALNKQAQPASPEAVLGIVIRLIAAPDIGPDGRKAGLDFYRGKSSLYDISAEIAEIEKYPNRDSGAARLKALRTIAGYDCQAAALISEILADDARMAALLAGQPIELEKLPDGTVP